MTTDTNTLAPTDQSRAKFDLWYADHIGDENKPVREAAWETWQHLYEQAAPAQPVAPDDSLPWPWKTDAEVLGDAIDHIEGQDRLKAALRIIAARTEQAAPAQDDDALTAAYMAGSHDAKKAARTAAQPVAVVASRLGDICSFRSSVARKGDVVYFQPPAQAQAQEDARLPLTDKLIDRAIAELGLNYLADAHETNRSVLRKLCHYAHGIAAQLGTTNGT